MTGIVHKIQEFAIIDEEVFINEVYKTHGIRINPALFDVNGPYMMDSQFEAMKKPNRRIRKRKRPVNEKIDEIWTEISLILEQIQEVGTSAGCFRPSSQKDNNKQAREAAQGLLDAYSVSLSHEFELKRDGEVWCNDSDDFVTVKVENSYYVIPPQAKFLNSRVDYVENLERTFDLIVADPPWMNKSAKRTAGYELSDDVFHTLSIECLSEKGLICVWITNQPRVLEETKSTLKMWGMETIAVWNWLKVTREGEPVCDCQSGHKVPFERLLVACQKKMTSFWKNLLPEKFVFVSVPMAVHSRKPPMQLVFRAFNLSFFRPLELFARCLWPNTTSIGLETTLLQNTIAFKQNKDE